MNRRFGLFFVFTLLILSVTLAACLGGRPQQPATAVPEKVAVTAGPAVITPTRAATATKALTPTITASTTAECSFTPEPIRRERWPRAPP